VWQRFPPPGPIFGGGQALMPRPGLYPWPVWNDLPAWMPPGSHLLGLATGLAGLLAGTLILRVIAFLFRHGRGMEGLGVGDADLMMMVGCFLGWQPVVVAFFVAVAPGLVIALLVLATKGEHPMPFGPSLALGVLLTLFGWRWIGPRFQPLFFDRTLLLVLACTGAVLLLLISFMLRLVRGTPPEEPPGKGEPGA